MSAWVQTYCGVAFDLLEPKPEQVFLLDIAQALSQLCRFTGHTLAFYSVAQHSVLVSRALPREFAAAGLLHDAAEAYVGDMSRPLKHVPGAEFYRAVEQRVWGAIAARFALPLDLPAEVKAADDAALFAERRDLMGSCEREWAWKAEPLPEPIRPWSSSLARDIFLYEFAKLRRAGLVRVVG